MKFRSIAGNCPPVSFREALFQGMAPDRSLYVPEVIPPLPSSILRDLGRQSLHSLGRHVISRYIDEIQEDALEDLIRQAWDFPIPLVPLDERIFLLELFHGPTLAFKDIGARFMAHTMSYFLSREERAITIIVATSGDTGSAVAHSFYHVPHITVYVLYPSGKVSKLQEQQMTTLGGNIHAVEVEGTFDDCQHLVKLALADPEIQRKCSLTTANSINLGRLIPQITYYVWAIAQWQSHRFELGYKPFIIVPSGNFGNLTAAIYAKWMGVSIAGFIAATNANDAVPEYLRTGTFMPRPSVQTYSNAMDVGNPSNLARLQALVHNDISRLREELDAISVSDTQTLEEIRLTYERRTVVLDPHTAVGVCVARHIQKERPNSPPIIVTATAHAGKFPEVIEQALGRRFPLPEQLERAMRLPKLSTRIKAEFAQLKTLMLHS